MEQRRLYIGGLSDAVLEKDIKKKFSEFGTVKDVELRCKENYGNRRYFAYINIQADKTNLDNCESRFSLPNFGHIGAWPEVTAIIVPGNGSGRYSWKFILTSNVLDRCAHL